MGIVPSAEAGIGLPHILKCSSLLQKLKMQLFVTKGFCHKELHLRFCSGPRLVEVTEVEKEAPNRMKISKIQSFLQAFSYHGGCFRKIFGTTFNNSKQVNAPGTNSITYCVICSVNLLHFLEFVKKTYYNSLKTCFLFFPYNIPKKMCARSLN